MYSRYNHQSKSSLEAASEAAAKVNAMLIAEGKLKLSQVNQHYTSRAKPGGLFVSEVEINEAPVTCRNILTKGTTQEDIMKVSGAAVSTRGRYIPIEQKSRGSEDRPLYLYVQGTTQQSVNIAIKKINEMLKGEPKANWIENNNQFLIPPPETPIPQINQLPSMTAPLSRFLRPPPEPAMVTFLQEKIYIGLEHAPPSFDVKNKIIGPGGCYLRHVMSESGAIASLCGKGAGFGEADSIEPMHIQIQHPSMEGLQNAKSLASNLILTVQQEYAQFQQAIAALPPAISTGPAQLYMGVNQQTSIPGSTLIGQPGIATITTLTPPSVLPPGIQPGQGIVGTTMLPVSSPSTMILPTVSLNSSLAPSSMINMQQAIGNGPPSIMMPSSIGSSYTTMAITSPLVASSLPTGQIISHNIDTGGLSSENVVLVPNTSVPPPILQAPPAQTHQFEITNPNSQFIAVPAEGQILMSQHQQPGGQVTVVGPPQTVISTGQLPTIITTPSGQTMELVHQPNPQPPSLQPLSQPPLPPFSVISSQPYSCEISASTTSITMSNPASNHPYNTAPKEEPKRRFTEEKPEECIPENLLGYQHGPLHLMNQGGSQSGPLHSDSSTTQFDLQRSGLLPPFTDEAGNLDQQLMPPPPSTKTGLKRVSQASDDEPRSKKDKNILKKGTLDFASGDKIIELNPAAVQENGNQLPLVTEFNSNEQTDSNLMSNEIPNPKFQPYSIAISSAPTIYSTRVATPPASSFGPYSQPPPDQPQFITTGPLPDQQLYPGQPHSLSSQSLSIHNPSLPVVSMSIPMSSQAMAVVSQPIQVNSQPMMPVQSLNQIQPLSNQPIPGFNQPVSVTSQPMPVFSQSLPIQNQSTLQYRPPSPQGLQWGGPASAFYQNNQPPQWNGQSGALSEATYNTPSSQPAFTSAPTIFTAPPPPTFNQPPPPMPFWVGPN